MSAGLTEMKMCICMAIFLIVTAVETSNHTQYFSSQLKYVHCKVFLDVRLCGLEITDSDPRKIIVIARGLTISILTS
jgi:hypothetical protein